MTKPLRILSGMQPTGELHLGNYLGALKQWAALLQGGQFEALFCIVDAHAITAPYEASELPSKVHDALVTYLAAGLDPERCSIFVQSHVPEHMELAWYLNAVTPLGDLQRMTQFKEKSEQHKHNLNAGILTYPILMAADILLYKANTVPVGDDQVQHLELTREICRRFNARFGEIFVEPQPKLSSTPRIMGLDGQAKMSKSKNNALGLLEEPKAIEKKIKKAFTDPLKLKLGDPGRPEICNIFTMHTALSSKAQVDEIAVNCRSGKLGCGECKQLLLNVLLPELEPIRHRAAELKANPKRVLKVLNDGAAAAHAIADPTMKQVRRAMGLGREVSGL
ncbi:MAG TPA: tryptophan--tRNA ligase [Polyangiaceae bacterium]|nr:tryptophan--tRNA ligase [Polyangiaceae bacterium]